MQTTLVSVLVIVAQWGIPANAQTPASRPLTSGPAATNRYSPHPLAKRLLFVVSDPKTMGRTAARTPAPHAAGAGGFLRPSYMPRRVGPPSSASTLEFHPTGMLPVKSSPPPDSLKF